MNYATIVLLLALTLPNSVSASEAPGTGSHSQEAPAEDNTFEDICAEAETEDRSEHAFKHPEQVDVLDQSMAVQCLWEKGDRERAFFWYYVFGTLNSITIDVLRATGLAQGELEMPLSFRLAGLAPMTWAMSDPEKAKVVMLRAIDFANRLPDPPEFAGRVSPALLRAAKDRVRLEFVESMSSGDLETSAILKRRRETGMRVGPWTDAGQPLLDIWK